MASRGLTDDSWELKIEDGVWSWEYENGVVMSNGDVTPCCYDSSGAHTVANVHRDGGLLQILKNPPLTARTAFADGLPITLSVNRV